ncbi:MAG: VanZ family protein [Gemmatimonadaceae bacterium]|jgi:glycopeptide antibiotics resistance protein|nr:VanZ family protein [Gemmatimonadaceae bacterium]
MNATPVATVAIPPLPYAARRREAATIDSGARLSWAVLGYLGLLIAALTLMPFGFVVPRRPALTDIWTWHDIAFNTALFVPIGFLGRRAWRPRGALGGLTVIGVAALASVAVEGAQLFLPQRYPSLLDLAANVGGAVAGVALFDLVARRHRGHEESASDVLLLQLPLMGLLYLLVPLLWITARAAVDDTPRLALTGAVALMGASILGSVARAMIPVTVARAWWTLPAAAAAWAAIGVLPAADLDPRWTVAVIALAAGMAAWRGRLSAGAFVERRYEVPALRALTPWLAIFLVGSAIWPARAFRSTPLWHVGLPTAESGFALMLPVIEAVVGSSILGYVIAEFHGRRELRFATAWPRIAPWIGGCLVGSELLRSVLAYEGASVLRLGLSLVACVYGAWLYHLQREHVKVVARRRRAAREGGPVAVVSSPAA